MLALVHAMVGPFDTTVTIGATTTLTVIRTHAQVLRLRTQHDGSIRILKNTNAFSSTYDR